MTAPIIAAINVNVVRAFDEMGAFADDLQTSENQEANAARTAAERSHRETRRFLLGGVAVSLFCALGAVVLLIRNLVPRIRTYSSFATQMASGHPPDALRAVGSDELAVLGRALNDMLAGDALSKGYAHAQSEFVDTLPVLATEEEAHGLLKRHVERSVPESTAVVLKRNNSANRLEAATAVALDDPIENRLVGADPRSCLALRLGRTHHEGSTLAP